MNTCLDHSSYGWKCFTWMDKSRFYLQNKHPKYATNNNLILFSMWFFFQKNNWNFERNGFWVVPNSNFLGVFDLTKWGKIWIFFPNFVRLKIGDFWKTLKFHWKYRFAKDFFQKYIHKVEIHSQKNFWTTNLNTSSFWVPFENKLEKVQSYRWST